MITEGISLAVYQKMIESGIPFEKIALQINELSQNIGKGEFEWSKLVTTTIMTIGGGIVGGFISAAMSLDQDRTDPPPSSPAEARSEELSTFGVHFGFGFVGGAIFTLGAIALYSK